MVPVPKRIKKKSDEVSGPVSRSIVTAQQEPQPAFKFLPGIVRLEHSNQGEDDLSLEVSRS